MAGMAGYTENSGANSNSGQAVHLDDLELEPRTVGPETPLTVNPTASAENNIATSASNSSDDVTLDTSNVTGPSQIAVGAVTLRVLPDFQNHDFVEEALQELNYNDFLDGNAGNNGAMAFPGHLLEVDDEATPNVWSMEHLRNNIENASAENNSVTSTTFSNVAQNTLNVSGRSQFAEGAVALRVLPVFQNDGYVEEALQELNDNGFLDGGYQWYPSTTIDLGDPASGRIRPVRDDEPSSS